MFYQPVKLVLCEGFLTACKLSGIGHLNSHTMHRLERERGYANNLDAQIHPDTHILTVKKLWLVLTQQSIHDKVSTYYCLKMCWVTANLQWRRCQLRQAWQQIHPVTLTFWLIKLVTCLDSTILHIRTLILTGADSQTFIEL